MPVSVYFRQHLDDGGNCGGNPDHWRPDPFPPAYSLAGGRRGLSVGWDLCDKTGGNRLGRFPEAASEDLLAGPKRNFQVFDPLELHRAGSERGDRKTAVREAHIPLRALTRRAWEANIASLCALGRGPGVRAAAGPGDGDRLKQLEGDQKGAHAAGLAETLRTA